MAAFKFSRLCVAKRGDHNSYRTRELSRISAVMPPVPPRGKTRIPSTKPEVTHIQAVQTTRTKVRRRRFRASSDTHRWEVVAVGLKQGLELVDDVLLNMCPLLVVAPVPIMAASVLCDKNKNKMIEIKKKTCSFYVTRFRHQKQNRHISSL